MELRFLGTKRFCAFEIPLIWRALWFRLDSVVEQSTARLSNGAEFQWWNIYIFFKKSLFDYWRANIFRNPIPTLHRFRFHNNLRTCWRKCPREIRVALISRENNMVPSPVTAVCSALERPTGKQTMEPEMTVSVMMTRHIWSQKGWIYQLEAGHHSMGGTWSWSHVCVIDVLWCACNARDPLGQKGEREFLHAEQFQRTDGFECRSRGHGRPDNACVYPTAHRRMLFTHEDAQADGGGYEREADRMIGLISKTTPSHNRKRFYFYFFPSSPFLL